MLLQKIHTLTLFTLLVYKKYNFILSSHFAFASRGPFLEKSNCIFNPFKRP